jgi:hypothetical protein
MELSMESQLSKPPAGLSSDVVNTQKSPVKNKPKFMPIVFVLVTFLLAAGFFTLLQLARNYSNRSLTFSFPSTAPTTTQFTSNNCPTIKIYAVVGEIQEASSWRELSSEELERLPARQVIYVTIAVDPVKIKGNSTKARIRASTGNETALPFTQADETVLKKPKATASDQDEYYVLYTIPDGASPVDIHFDGQIFAGVGSSGEWI